MRPSGEEEEQRFLGFPTSMWSRFWGRRGGRVDWGRALHPVTWIRWRAAVRRSGPYAPDFEQFRAGPSSRG